MTSPDRRATPLARARWHTLAAAAVLAACVARAALGSAPWPTSLAWVAALLLPVLAPLAGLVRGRRRTYAWATLCVAPYFIYGITESVANPALRVAAASILFASLAWFVTLVRYLRLTRSRDTAGQAAPGG